MLRLSAGNQFGMDKETLMNTLTRIKEDDLVGICGIQYYSGTQKTEKKMITELKMLEELGKELTAAGFSDLELEYGPGLFISYFDDGKAIKREDVEDEDSYGRQDGLYEQLTDPNFHIGLKKGVIPIYLAVIIHMFKKHIVITKSQKELEITAALIESINNNPQDYYIELEEWDTSKEEPSIPKVMFSKTLLPMYLLLLAFDVFALFVL